MSARPPIPTRIVKSKQGTRALVSFDDSILRLYKFNADKEQWLFECAFSREDKQGAPEAAYFVARVTPSPRT